jgi:hypothetical protein
MYQIDIESYRGNGMANGCGLTPSSSLEMGPFTNYKAISELLN